MNQLSWMKRPAMRSSVTYALFEVLDLKYADDRWKTINKRRGNQEYLLNLLQNNTSVVYGTNSLVEMHAVFNKVMNNVNNITTL